MLGLAFQRLFLEIVAVQVYCEKDDGPQDSGLRQRVKHHASF
jgi:hypothetical protein